jgi:hypothetical protein
MSKVKTEEKHHTNHPTLNRPSLGQEVVKFFMDFPAQAKHQQP